MQDMADRLAQLGEHSASMSSPSDDIVAADVDRGRRALRRRSARRGVVGVAGVAAVAAVVSVAIAGTSHQASPEATGPSRPAHSQAPSSGAGTSTAVAPSTIELVAYQGRQRAGFTVKYVPSGYVLQGVTGSTLDVSTPDDHTPLDTFSGKLTVGIEEVGEGAGLSGPGRRVTVNGRPGIISTDNYGTTLRYDQGSGSNNVVTVQCWKNIALTQDQVVDFAKGVTVTAAAQRQHG